MTVRDYAVLYLGPGGKTGGATLGGGNVVLAAGQHKLDGVEHLAADDTTRLDASDTAHGLLPKLSGVLGDVLRGDGTWSPATIAELGDVDLYDLVDGDVLAWDEGLGLWLPAPQGGTTATDTTLVTVADAGPAETIDVSVARTYDLTLTEDCTLTLAGAVTAESWFVTVLLRQDGTGGWEVTWPGSVEWPGGVTPTLSTDPNAVDVFTLFSLDGGTSWFGFPTGGTGTGPLALDDLTDVAITSATEGDALRYRTGEWVNEALTIPTATVLIPVDTGTPTYDTTGDNVEVTVATVWGLDVDDPYYDAAGALGGEEAALFWDPENLIYVLLPFNFPVGGS